MPSFFKTGRECELINRQINVILPANTRNFPNVVLMLGRRRRRRANINPAMGQCIVFAILLHNNWTLYESDFRF